MIEIRLLGELEVLRDGVTVPLPASRKSRALLGLLAATARPHLRERLCEMLWEGPDDPRAALRWSLARIRPLVDPHLIASRDRVELQGADVDLARIGNPSTATTEQLEMNASLYRGEFLEGLDLESCFRYHQWCTGERERHRQTHVAILDELTRRLSRDEAALPHARRRVMIDPFSDAGHASLISLLASFGQNHDALRQYEQCRQLFERELGRSPGEAVENARRLVGRPAPAARVAPPQPSVQASSSFIGRRDEIERIESAKEPLLILGEPGIGKSRLLEELRRRTPGKTLYGRAMAAEMVRPYGLWIDALGSFPDENEQSRLFDVVVEKLEGIELITIDDVQWIDEGSAALLHYVGRKTSARLVVAARIGEIDDNAHASRLAFDEMVLGPLSPEETRELVSDESAAERSGGNPLYALELSRSPRGEAIPGGALSRLIARRLDQLQGAARELVSWAAATGRQFDDELIGRATAMPAGEMLTALEKLERSAIIRVCGDARYDFTHDLLRDAAYRMMSPPRRALVHRHLARALGEMHDPDWRCAGEIVHHAALAGDLDTAARAAIRSGQYCLRMFAYAEAMSVARRGLQMTEAIDVQMELLNVIVMSRTPLHERITYSPQIAKLTEAARQDGLVSVAALGAHLLAVLHEESNNYERAANASLRSAELARSDPATAAFAIANTARCLLFLQRDVDRAETLLAEAQALGMASSELSLAHGFLHAHRGQPAAAVPHLEQAFALASRDRDHWREWLALWKLATVALEEGDAGAALSYCSRLHAVASRMSGGSEAVRTEVLESIARHAAGEPVDVDAALSRLRSIDSKSDLAWALSLLAQIDEDQDRARRYASESLQAAEAVGRQSEAAIARCLLGLPVKATRDITARARRFIRERRSHGHTRARAEL